MKKKLLPAVAILLLLVLAAILYFSPKTFGKNVSPSEVDRISVFDGSTGVGFTVTDPEDIRYIVENIQSCTMKRSGISLGRMGYLFQICYIDSSDKPVIPLFFISSENTIRKDPFFYTCEGSLCVDRLKALEPDLSVEAEAGASEAEDPAGERVSVDCGQAAFSFLLPAGWTYSIEQPENAPSNYTAAVIFPQNPGTEGEIRIQYTEDPFGVCGTGLETEDIIFNGHAAVRGYYDGSSLWDFIMFMDGYRGFAVINSAENWYDEYSDVIEDILASIELVSPSE